MKSFNKSKKLFLILIIFSLLTLANSISNTIYFSESNPMISINEEVIYLNNTNNNISSLKNGIIGVYDDNIQSKKELINLDDSSFVIFGLNSFNYLCYQIFNYTNNNLINYTFVTTNINFNSVIQNHIHCNVNYCIVALTKNNQFEINEINLNSSDSVIDSFVPSGNYIKCSSFQIGKIFCIFGLISGNQGKISYRYYDNKNIISSKDICSNNCFMGSVDKLKVDSTEKFLVCYQKRISANVLINDRIICQYYELNNNGINEGDINDNIFDINNQRINQKYIIILNVHDYSVFLKVTYFIGPNANVAISFFQFFSFDFKIKFEYEEEYQKQSINVLNDNKYYYDFYYYQSSMSYILNINPLLQTNPTKEVYFSRNDYEPYDFSLGHSGETLYLILDQNTELYKNEIKINNNNLEVKIVSVNSSDIFEFGKPSTDILTIYYCYYSNGISSEDDSFSLIDKVQLKKCYDSCKYCVFNSIGDNTNHLCTECNEEFYPFYEITKSSGDIFNCYLKNSTDVSRAYFTNGIFKYCDDTCNSCESDKDCLTCKNGYYFKVDNNNIPFYNEYCLNLLPDKYYFDFTANIVNKKNETIQSVYKPCFEKCASCEESGTEEENNCISCINGLMKYEFNENQCLINTSLCTDESNFWKLEKNNISCLEDCNSSIISEGKNKGQCIEDCKNYINPYIKIGAKDTNYLSLTCLNKTYCIPYESCNEIGFTPSKDGSKCIGICDDYDIFNFTNIIEYINSLPVPPPPPPPNITLPNITEKKLIIDKRKRRIEVFKETKNYEQVINSFGIDLIANYSDLFKKQGSNPEDIAFLITSTTYDNFTISIYPLDIEKYAYENLFLVKNLGFINFTKVYPDFLDYEVDTGKLILICIMEYFTHNYSVNDLNYFIYSFDELSNTSFRLLQEQEKLDDLPTIEDLIRNDTNEIEIEYPLYNYINDSVKTNKRNSEYLVNNIKQMYKDYPEVDLSDINDQFYNDICYKFTSDVGTDMTLNDRRNEYYVNYSLCEENCTLINIINKDSNPRAVCICEAKNHLIFNSMEGEEYPIDSHSSPPIKTFLCFKETFNIYIGKNPIFWIFIIILIYQIYLFIIYIKYQSSILDNIFGIGGNYFIPNDEGSNLPSSIISKIIINENDFKSSKNKDSSIKEKESSNKGEKRSAPVNIYNNPPKKKELTKDNATTNNNNVNTNDKDLISRDDSTFVKENVTNVFNQRNNEESEITYSDIKNGFDIVEVNNLVEQNTIMENNFLKSPLQVEKIKKMKKIKKAMNPLKEEETKKYCETVEDILFSNKNKHKFKNKKNKNIANFLGGNDIINKNLIDNLSEDENKPGFPKNIIDQNLTSEKYRTIGSDHIMFSGTVNNNNENKIKNDLNKDSLDMLFDTKKNTLAKSLGKKEMNNLKSGSDKKLKTDEDLENENIKIKKELIKIGKDKKTRPFSGIDKNQNKKYIKKPPEKKYKNIILNNNNSINNNNNKNNNIENNKNRTKEESIKLNNKYNNKYSLNQNQKLIDDSDNSANNLKNKLSESDNNNIMNSKQNQSKIRTLKLKNIEIKEENNNITNKIEVSNSDKSSNKNSKKDILLINKKDEKISTEKEISKVSNTKRLIKFQEETEMEGDKANKDIALEKLKLKRTQNLELLNDKVVVSSVVEFLETENKEIMIEDYYLLFYWKYFIKRELWFLVIRDNKNSLPYFIRYSCLGLCLSFICLINCLFFFESTVHRRYINALEGVNLNIKYYFQKEFWRSTIFVALISNVIKMIIIKIVLYKVFKIGKMVKKLMRNSAEKGLTKEEVELLYEKREKYLLCYRINLFFYFFFLLALTILIGYICTCYGGIYKNSMNSFLFGFVFSIISSFIFCAIICFLIVSLYKIGKISNSKCIVSSYIVLSTLY